VLIGTTVSEPLQRLRGSRDICKPLATADLGILLGTWLKPGVTESLPKRPRHARRTLVKEKIE